MSILVLTFLLIIAGAFIGSYFGVIAYYSTHSYYSKDVFSRMDRDIKDRIYKWKE